MGLGWVWWRAWGPLVGIGCGTFAWQAWRLVTSTCTLRGRRGAWRHPPSFCVAAWYLWDWAGSGGALGSPWHLATSTVVLRGRPGTYGAVLGLVARLGLP